MTFEAVCLIIKAIPQGKGIFCNHFYDFFKFQIWFTRRVVKPPILTVLAWQVGTRNIAAHCNNNVNRRYISQQL